MLTAVPAFLLTAFSLAELGDGFGMFFDMYLLGLGWGETYVIVSQILRGVVDFCLKGVVGDVIDKTTWDRRWFLSVAACSIALSSLMVFFVNGDDTEDVVLVYTVRAVESIALAFLPPTFGALTLSAFGPEMFDQMNVQKELVSHFGAIVSSGLSALMAWFMYPNIQILFCLPILFAVSAMMTVQYIPEGDPLMGRGFHGTTEQRDKNGCVINTHKDEPPPTASTYREVFTDKRIVALIAADVLHAVAEANVGLIFNETLADVGTYSSNNNGGDDDYNNDDEYGYGDDDGGDDDNVMKRTAIPLLAAAGSLAQLTMIVGTFVVGYLTTKRGWGRKPFYVAHLAVHPIRVLLLLLCLWTNASSFWLASTELVGGLTGALGIVNAFMRADILFGSGRFNVVDGVQATIRGIFATSSSLIGAYILQYNGPMVALGISFVIAVIPPIVGAIFVPETLGMREVDFKDEKQHFNLQRVEKKHNEQQDKHYVEMVDQEKNAEGAPPSSATTAELSASEGQTQGGEPKILDVYKAPGVV